MSTSILPDGALLLAGSCPLSWETALAKKVFISPFKWVLQDGQNRKTTLSLLIRRVFLVKKRTFFLGRRRLVIWMLHIGRARHPGPGKRYFHPVGVWLTCGDLALDSCAQFLAVAELPSRVRSIGHLLHEADHQSVWSPACQGSGCCGSWCCQPGVCSSCLAHICYT